ncbi:hypothetical protein ABZT03_35295 [Streptomyces sp. NPDC005574]|uniref:hypothetical protein n=1 Tax=Streptomyces sp. NPDC005574 TaxID=3156891 RepID=UPI0033BED8E6
MTRETDVQVITLIGSEESDLLHAAGAWMAEHLVAVLLGLNWVGDFLSPHDINVPGPPRHRLDLTVDLSNERLNRPGSNRDSIL